MKQFMSVLLLSFLIGCNWEHKSGIIEDPRLEKAVRRSIGKNQGKLSQSDLSLVKKLGCNRVKNLQGVQFMINLGDAAFVDGKYKDLSPLVNLKNLWSLNLSRSDINDITLLSGLENLEYLNLTGNDIQDITPLIRLKKLRVLWIFDNQISDLSAIIHLQNLETFLARHNRVSRLPDFGMLAQLRTVDLAFNDIGNDWNMSSLRRVPDINLAGNKISDFEWFIDWTDVGRLNLLKNPIGCPENDDRFNALVRSRRVLIDCAN